MKVDDLELMRFHDRELDEDGARRIRAASLRSTELECRLEALALLGGLVREWAAASGVDATRERRELVGRRRRRTAFLGALSVAACLALFESSAASPVSPPRPAVALESVDFGRSGGTIFVVETDSAATMVVWLSDGPEAGRIGTL